MGSISDVELTRVSGFLDTLKNKPGISIIADRGFTIQDQLKPLGVNLNIPPFMEVRKQLPTEEVLKGRQIASVRIHVERAIGRIRNYSILKGTLPLSMARLANQIVCMPGSLTFSQLLFPFLNVNSLTKKLKAISSVCTRVTMMQTQKTVKKSCNVWNNATFSANYHQ